MSTSSPYGASYRNPAKPPPLFSRQWATRRIGMIAAAVELADKSAIDYAFEGLPYDETESLTCAVRDFLLCLAGETGDWRVYAESMWLLPHKRGAPALEFQRRIDAAVSAANTMSPKKRVQKVIACVAADLIGDGIKDRDLLVRLSDYNATFIEPLSDRDVEGIAAWAQKASRSGEPPAGHPASA